MLLHERLAGDAANFFEPRDGVGDMFDNERRRTVERIGGGS